jgi:hypothetical protein
MQNRLFVFIGLQNDNLSNDLNKVLDKLNDRFSKANTSIQFVRKDKLVSTRIEGVSFYISLLTSRDEIDDWVQMATDFELTIDLSTVNKEILNERYEEMKKALPNLYTDIHYSVATSIFEEMNSLPGTSIYSFQ